MNLKELLNYGKKQLGSLEDYAILLKILAEHIFGIKREQIILSYDKELDNFLVNRYMSDVQKLKSGIPIQYITNCQEFMGVKFYVDENVLIPQPDTEILVQEVIDKYLDQECKILDLCTGSGAIAISLAKYIQKSYIVATDISDKALQIAKLNAERNLVHKKIEFIKSDMFENINYTDFDVIVSNPPYIKTSEIQNLDQQVKNEPIIALDGGTNGLKFYEQIVKNSYKHAKTGGKLFLEIGYDQKQDVVNLLNENKNYKNIYSKKDFGNNDRIVVAEFAKETRG